MLVIISFLVFWRKEIHQLWRSIVPRSYPYCHPSMSTSTWILGALRWEAIGDWFWLWGCWPLSQWNSMHHAGKCNPHESYAPFSYCFLDTHLKAQRILQTGVSWRNHTPLASYICWWNNTLDLMGALFSRVHFQHPTDLSIPHILMLVSHVCIAFEHRK